MTFTASKRELGTNVESELSDKGILTLRIDLKKEFGRSASGKTTIIATTKGNAALEGAGGAVVGLNIYKK